MQPDLEYGKPRVVMQNLETTKNELFQRSEEYFSHIEALVTDSNIPYSSEVDTNLAGNPLVSPSQKQQVPKREQRPSLAIWRSILTIGDIFLLMTILMVVLILISSHHLMFQTSNDAFSIRNAKLIWICLALASWALAVNITQSQDLSYASSRFKSPLSALFALMLMNIFWIVLSYLLLNITFITSAWLELFFLTLTVPVFSTWRILLAQVMNMQRFRPQAVIVGVNPAGETIAKELLSAKHPGTSIIGYIGESTEEKSYLDGLPILGGRSVLRHLMSSSVIDTIIMALDYTANPELFKETLEAAQFGIAVLPMTVVYENSTGKIPVEHIGDQWYAALQSERIVSPFYLFWKKGLDFAFGLCGLLVLGLMVPIIVLFIYLDSPGPIFYSQKRVGLRGKPFRIYKFRSMSIDAEGRGRAIWASESDKRVTRIGRFLRATHLDELPQVINILRGDMSLIGPRPERAEFITELEKTIPFYRHRLAVKPGLTGWAQVKYRYGRSDNDALIKLQYDLYYIKRRSFMLDMFIILKTVVEVLTFRGS
jgi:exopolysaccharide biosynthesis polyprenyl glycosylphosphotransferase